MKWQSALMMLYLLGLNVALLWFAVTVGRRNHD
jgi:hypothetical protein